MNITLYHQICIELGQLGSTVVSIQTGYNPQICSNSYRRQCILGDLSPCRLSVHCWALNPTTSVAGISSPRPLGGLHSKPSGIVMLFPLSRLIHATGLRAGKLGVSALAGIKAKISKHVRGRLRGGWGWQCSLCMVC